MANSWREDTKQMFVNPYNFVRFDKDVKRSTPSEGELTGILNCKLITKTPLSLPDHETKSVKGLNNKDEHPSYEFFKVNGKPTITGSEIRGMIRSSYEAISNSCFSVNNNNVLSARHSFPRTPAILECDNSVWKLFRATSMKLKSFEHFKDEQAKISRRWFDINGKIINKFCFTQSNEIIPCDNIKEVVDNYIENLEIYNKNNPKLNKNTLINIPEKSNGNRYSVFYETVQGENGENLLYLSPAQISRSVFKNSLDGLLGTHTKCTSLNDLCDACNLFGMIGKECAKYSRVRFSDATILTEYELKKVTLKELASPKTTCIEFYSKRPEGALAWNYDYKTTAYKKDEQRKDIDKPLRTYLTDEKKVKINGRKFYLHSNTNNYSTTDETKRNSTMELIDKDAEFEFKIYFENLTQEELNKLIWTITIGENNTDSKQMHKIGHGKPLGLGSVKLTISDVTTRIFDKEKLTYSVHELNANAIIKNNPFDTDSISFKDFKKVTNFDLVAGKNVSYPIADSLDKDKEGKPTKNSTASHQWFIGNKQLGQHWEHCV